MEALILPLLAITLVLSFIAVILQFASWFMHNGLSNRVAKLEALQANTLTNAETIKIYERLSGLEALVETQADTLDTIKEHLLERDT